MWIKKILVFFISSITMCTMLSMPISAMSPEGELYQYVDIDGSIIEYYLDEAGNPYQYYNGEKLYLALPLEHLQVTDPAKIAELNQIFEMSVAREVPTDYRDLSTGSAAFASDIYSSYVTFENTNIFTSSVLKFHSQHSTIRIQATNIKKENIFASTNVNIIYYYYDIVLDRWSSATYSDKEVGDTGGFGIRYVASTCPYAQFQLTKSSALKSFNINIWTTPLYA